MTLLGVYGGSDPANVTKFEAWLGRPVDLVSVHTGEASWADFDGGVGYEISQFAPLPRPVAWSVPLIPAGADLASAASGAYNTHYLQAAKAIAAARHEHVIYVRTGWEFNGNWMKWASAGKEASFIAAFVQFAACFRQVSNRFKLVWCPNIGQSDPALSYPGDDAVDVIGMDVYHQPQWDPKDPDQAWSYMLTRSFGLNWLTNFAERHGKPICIPEWGVCLDNFGDYVWSFADWCRANKVVYTGFWDTNAGGYNGALSGGQYPATGASFKGVFGP